MNILKTLFFLFLCCSSSAQNLDVEDISNIPQDLNYFLGSAYLDNIYQEEIGGNFLNVIVQCDYKTTPEDFSPGSYQCWKNIYFSLVNDGAYVHSSLHVLRGLKRAKVLAVEFLRKEEKISVHLEYEDKSGVQRQKLLFDRLE